MAKNAPGKHYREGISLMGMMKMFPDDETAEKWFSDIRWPDGAHCPVCGSVNIQCGTKHKTMPYRCRACHKRFSVKVGTVMEGSKLGYQIWAVAVFLLNTNLKSVSSMKLHRDLNITQKSAWHLAMRIRKAWEDNSNIFSGPVEVDETYIEGKEKNKHSHKKLRAGRGGVGKIAVVGAKDRDTNRVVVAVIEDTKGHTLKGFVRSNSKPGAKIYTDDNRSYHGLENHETVCHSVGEYVRNMTHTNGIESFWAILKRGYHGTFHHFSKKHMHRYVNEFAGRHNTREEDTMDQIKSIATGFIGKRLRYQDLVA